MHFPVVGLVAAVLMIEPAIACGPIPLLGASIEVAGKQAKLSESEMSKLQAMLKEMRDLANTHPSQARDIEERAMALLGYDKAWLKCGSGTFGWQKR